MTGRQAHAEFARCILHGQRRGGNRVCILAGGINRRLDIYREHQADAAGPEVAATGDDRCRHRFVEVLGSRESLARLEARTVQREFPTKVQVVTAKRVAGGGCG